MGGTHGRSLTRYAWLSVATAVATIGTKLVAYLLTGSVGLLSDALESVVNLVAALVALAALRVAARPPDEEHHYGHGKAEYLAAVVEGLMILVAAAAIVATAVDRLLHPAPLERVGAGLAVSLVATVLNGAVGTVLVRAGARYRSPTLAADGRHLLTDVWTSGGVVVGVLAVALTGWERLDPLIALAVGANILVTGFRLVRRSVGGLMDEALPAADRAAVDAVLARHRSDEVRFHDVRTRAAGRHRFVSLHVLVPGGWSVERGHDLLEAVESDLRAALEDTVVHTHLEPLPDAAGEAADGEAACRDAGAEPTER